MATFLHTNQVLALNLFQLIMRSTIFFHQILEESAAIPHEGNINNQTNINQKNIRYSYFRKYFFNKKRNS